MADTYTYYGGKKVSLAKRADQFVTRALPTELSEHGICDATQVSSASSRVVCRPDDLERMMSRGRMIAPTHHVYERADTGDDFLLTDRVMIRFKRNAGAEAIDKLIGKYGLVKMAAFDDRSGLYRLTSQTGMNPVKLVVALVEEETSVVDVAENDVNHRLTKMQFTAPTDPHYVAQWHLHNRNDNPQVDPRSSARVEEAWRLLDGTGHRDVVIGVTDDGCKLSHDDFDSDGKFASWGYFQGTRLITEDDIDADPAKMYETGANHGTSCAGVAAAELDGVLTVGAAPGCRLLPIKWESQGPFLLISDSKLLTALNFLADKVDIVSNSWGRRPVSSWSAFTSEKVRELAAGGGRRGNGVLFLWAAGNENCPIDHHHAAADPIPYTHGWECGRAGCEWVGPDRSFEFGHVFANTEGVMLVGAVASTAQRSHYSNYGEGLDLCAPSSNSHAYFRATVDGRGVTTTTGSGGDVDPLVTSSFGGTSSATPLVAGIAALVISANQALSAAQVVQILKRTASKDLNLEGYSRTPPASYDPDTSWDISPVAPFDSGDFSETRDDGTWSPWFGYGLVNAEAAVEAALSGETPAAGATPRAAKKKRSRKASPRSSAGKKRKSKTRKTAKRRTRARS